MTVKANLVNGIKSIGGELRFYDNYFEFIMYGTSVNVNSGKVFYNEIKTVELCNICRVFPTGIRVSLLDGTEKVFAVQNRTKVKYYLKDKISRNR